MIYVIRYQRDGDVERVKRGNEGCKRRFTRAEAKAFLFRNRRRYPNARLVPLVPGPTLKVSRVERARAAMLTRREDSSSEPRRADKARRRQYA